MTTKGPALDLEVLEEEAREQQSKETYQQVSGGKDHRLGVVVAVSPVGELVHSIELLICIFQVLTELEVQLMERAIGLSKELKAKGYLVLYEEDGWISCTKTVPRNEVVLECGTLLDLLKRFKAEGG